MARLLVSVRSSEEARAAVLGGADIIDVKEPLAGPLGCAEPSVWPEIRRVVPESIPLSVALGEVEDWTLDLNRVPDAPCWLGITFAKVGLAGSGVDWLSRWTTLRERFDDTSSKSLSWVAVIYADWLEAKAPQPDEIIAEALCDTRCAGVLVDTWSKSGRPSFWKEATWPERIERVQRSRRLFAWAGGMDVPRIHELAQVGHSPDIIAVRGSACRDGDRLGPIEVERVARLKEAVTEIETHIRVKPNGRDFSLNP